MSDSDEPPHLAPIPPSRTPAPKHRVSTGAREVGLLPGLLDQICMQPTPSQSLRHPDMADMRGADVLISLESNCSFPTSPATEMPIRRGNAHISPVHPPTRINS